MLHPKGDAATKIEPADAVGEARTKARQRLIGAAVLLVVAIVAFPLIFETEPRPVSIDIPIEIPRRETSAPLVVPPAPVAMQSASSPRVQAATGATGSTIASTEAATNTATAPSAAARVVPPPSPRASVVPSSTTATTVTAPTAIAKEDVAPPAADGERARAILESRAPDETASAPAGVRFVVQVGAFADNDAAVATRKRVEQLGLKTYTQVAETPAGHRIRVRVGPFASRSDAEVALARAKSAGMQAVLLTL